LIIKEISDALRRLINSLALRPLPTLAGVLIIVTAYIGYRSYDMLERSIISPTEESERFKAQLESAELVNEAIENLVIDLDAHSVVIRQFHNGRHDLTGIPFTEATSTFYTEQFDEIKIEEPLSASNRSLRRMWTSIDNPQCIILTRGIDISTSRYFYKYGLSRVAVCPLVNPLKYPIGTITVGLSAQSTTSDKEIVARTHAISKSVVGYLQNAVPEETLY
jgi:hypothetical protein